ncbi:hypothetical protein [Hyphomicrobium sp.]|uniref:hypothetical protein n=1 Tax=Hyphomicrobium sp. TaxID=82 RepID=UPI003F6EBD98
MTGKKKQARDPLSATAREVVRDDDDFVSRAVTDREDAKGSQSILPGPPIPPDVQEKLRKQKKND